MYPIPTSPLLSGYWGKSHLIPPTCQREKEHITHIDIWLLAVPHFSLTETLIQPQPGCFQIYGLIYFRF